MAFVIFIKGVWVSDNTTTLKQQYYDSHKYCPACGSDKYSTTYMGYLFTNLNEFKDENSVRCECGWEGIHHDLVKNNSAC